MKSSSVPNMAGKKGQMLKDIQQIQDSVSCADFRPPDDKMDDQMLTEDQMAWRYSGKKLSLSLSTDVLPCTILGDCLIL